jgi:hypothetical protein
MVIVKVVPDIFSSEGRQELALDLKGKDFYLSAFIDPELYKKAGLDKEGLTPNDFIECCDIWYEGKAVDPKEFGNIKVHDCSEIVFFVRPGGGDVFQFIFGGVLTAVGILVPGLSFLIPMGIGMIIGGIAQMLTPSMTPKNFTPAARNLNYGWGGVESDYAIIGSVVPICYGRVVTGGKCISQRIYANENYDQVLDLLMLVSEGEIRGIRKEDDTGVCTSSSDDPWIKLDGNFLSNLVGASWDYRLGTVGQSPIQGFNFLSSNYVDNQTLTPTWYEITNAGGGEDFDAVEFNFVFPAGLYTSSEYGMLARWVQIFIEQKEEPGGSWVSAGASPYTITAMKTGVFYRTIKIDGLGTKEYSFRVRRLREDITETHPYPVAETITLQSYNRIIYEDLAYPGSALVSIRAVASDQLSSGQPTVQVKLDGRKLQYYDGSWQSAVWDSGGDDVNACIITENTKPSQGASVGQGDAEEETDSGTIYQGFTTIHVGIYDSDPYMIGLQFVCPAPPDATISEATLKVRIWTSGGASTLTRIYGEAVDQPALITTANSDLSNRTSK